MWFGSRDGLNRYDGYEFKIYKSGRLDSIDLSGNNVQSLFARPNGDLWIGLATAGLCIFERSSQRIIGNPFEHIPLVDWKSLTVFSIFEDSFGNVWLGTNAGVLKIDALLNTIEHFSTGSHTKNRRLESDECFAFVEDLEHNVWMGTAGTSIHCYERGADSVIVIGHAEEREAMNSYRKSLFILNDKLWVGAEGSGLWVYDLGLKKFVDVLLKKSLVRDIASGADDQLLVSVDGEGLYAFSQEGLVLEHFQYTPTATNSINTNALYDIFVDDAENIWIGSFNGGVNVYKPGKAHFHTYIQSTDAFQIPGSQSVLALCEMRDGSVWLGMDGGGLWNFNIKDRSYTNFAKIFPLVRLKTEVTTSLFEDSRGFFWIGTFAQGLYRLDPATGAVKHYVEDISDVKALQNDNIWDITEDRSGNLWIGTLGGGLHRYHYDGDTFDHWLPEPDHPKSLSDRNVQVLLTDDRDNLWIGTENGGLNMLRRGMNTFDKWEKRSGDTSSLQSNTVRCLHQDTRGRIWVGTEGGGLYLMRADYSGFVRYTQQDGLPSNVVNAIEEADDGVLWISTNQGITSFDTDSRTFVRYDRNDDLASNQFNPNASITLKSGEMLFGNIRGLNGFEPEAIERKTGFPIVVFTDFKLFNTSVPVGSFKGRTILPSPLNEEPTIRLRRTDNAFTIEFAALDYTNPSKTSYAYRMEGFQDDWIMVDPNARSATFTNLAPGDYTFYVRASNHIGEWSDIISKLYINRIASFWETVWFKLIIALVLFAPVLVYMQYRIWKRKQEHEKEVAMARQEILLLKNTRLASEVERKNSELSAALLQSAHKNKALEGLKKKLSEILTHLENNPGERKELRRVVRKIDSEVESKDYWEQFQLNFDQVHRDFAFKIQAKHPDLTQNEVRLCCLVRINLTNREVASIQNISTSGVEKAKYRLKRKLSLNQDQDLGLYIANFV
jgi:ligand-binding sensor domain-containing protein/DNA-binding CsgD family transcriptional regulator